MVVFIHYKCIAESWSICIVELVYNPTFFREITAMSDDIQQKLSIPDYMVMYKAADNKWIDLICTHLAPSRGNDKALDFRITSIEDGNFKVEIHWDDGAPEEIHSNIPSDKIEVFINGYYDEKFRS